MHTIAVVSPKGGVGKSTIAGLLSFYFHENGLRVGLLDGDANESSSDWVSKTEPGITVTTAPRGTDIVNHVRAAAAQNRFDVLIGDGPGSMEEATRAFMLAADTVLIPCGVSSMDRRVTRKAIGVLKEAQKIRNDGGPLGFVVLSKMPPENRRVTRRALEATAKLDAPVCKTTLGLRDAFIHAVDDAIPIWELGPDSQLAVKEIDTLLREIVAYVQTRDGEINKGADGVSPQRVNA